MREIRTDRPGRIGPLLAAVSAIALATSLLVPPPAVANVRTRPLTGEVHVSLRHGPIDVPAGAPARAAFLSPARIRVAVLYGVREFTSAGSRSWKTPRSLRETRNRILPLEGQVEDEWIAMDKAKHVAFSFLWTLGTQYTAVNKGGLSEHRALPLSVTSGALIGLTKEYYDLRAGPTRFFSTRDLVADAVGIVLAVGVILF
jgi:uncharacterized protein YfiM (DUF2279 family)